MENFNELRELLDNSTTYYLITINMDSCYSYVNQHYNMLFQKQHGQLEGQHYAITMHPDDLATCSEVAAKCFAAPEKIFPATIRKHDGKGGYIATQWDYKAMFNLLGEPTGILCIGYDITSFMEKTVALEQMKYIQSHVIRKPIANLIGLLNLLQDHTTIKDASLIIEMTKGSLLELENIMQVGLSNSLSANC